MYNWNIFGLLAAFDISSKVGELTELITSTTPNSLAAFVAAAAPS